MSVYVISVPHTGTVFLARLLARHKVETARQHTHVPGIIQFLKSRPKVTLASPLRHPKACWGTWAARGTGDFETFSDAWNRLDEIASKRSVYFVPVDTRDRDRHLERLGDFLGIEIETDWAPQNSGPKSTAERDLSEVLSLPLVRRFYE